MKGIIGWRAHIPTVWTAIVFAVACAQPPPQTVPREPDSASLCACCSICAPDGYEWTLMTVPAGASLAGTCTCIGRPAKDRP